MSITPAHLQDERSVHSAGVAALSWIVYDTLIHLDQEIECIWRGAKPWIKIAYFFIRYAPIIEEAALKRTTTTDPISGCRGWVWEELIFAEVLTLVVEILLVIRLYVLFNQNKLILASMITAFIAEIAVMVTMLAIALPKMRFQVNCLVSGTPGVFMAFWLSSLAFETFLFALTIVAFFRSVKQEYGKHSVLFVFFRDGTWAFAIIFIAMLLNTLMYKLEKNPLAGMGYLWCLSVMSFAGSHILLNIRRLGRPEDASAVTLPPLEFESNSAQPMDTFLTTVIEPESFSGSSPSTSGCTTSAGSGGSTQPLHSKAAPS
ncbi:hypothetical protein NM688_g6444 [Phlebia brevispora]|uniref:Uncharacterized protein n=1 Tax=Phlebia brevispora TaxID=194682 RepID=A0ACC1SGB5_9APHY|nr:hypothetical protein NM688_g6444 [Phlebia brevispora]